MMHTGLIVFFDQLSLGIDKLRLLVFLLLVVNLINQYINKIINTIILTLEHKKDQFVEDMKTILGDDLFDESLLKETTEPIYDYIVEKIYQTPGYIEEEPFKNKRKLKIAFNKFYVQH